MYAASFGIDDPEQALSLLRQVSFGHLVTSGLTDGASALEATALPFVVDDSISTVRAHVARANPHWRDADGRAALLIVPVVDAYVSPRWYPSKAEHQRVVPTSNYGVIHLHGTVAVHHDSDWKLGLVNDLTDHSESAVDDPDNTDAWSVGDAPTDFVEKQLKAIVGIELRVTDIQLKLKLSQNKSAADRAGAVAGLGRSSNPSATATAELMRSSDA